MFHRVLAVTTAFAGAALAAGKASAFAVLVVNGSSTTSEDSTTSSITTQLSDLQASAGNSVTVVDTLPTDLSGYEQVWDIRFSSSSPLTSTDKSAYYGFLGDGKGLFLMGENGGFMPRNDTILEFIEMVGGGSLNFVLPSSSQTVMAPFNGPTTVSSVAYGSAGGVDSFGSGQWITTDGTNGTGVAWGVGDLSERPTGTLTAIFDVNFMQTGADADSLALLTNLVDYVDTSVEEGVGASAVPLPAPAALLGLGLLTLAGVRARRRT